MRALIAGSHGYLGRALTEALRSDGHEVHALVRTAPGAGEAGIDLAAGNIDCSGLPGGSLAEIDVVYQLAGEPLTPSRWGKAKRRAILDSRVLTTQVIANALAQASRRPGVLVSMSAIGYYGSRGDEVLVEGCAPGEGFLAQVCTEWEAATGAASAAGVRVVIARTGIVLGPGGGALQAQVPLFRLGLGGRLGTGRQWTSWIALDDEVRALVEAATNDRLAGPCNFTAPNPVRNLEFTRTLASALGRPALLAVPRQVLVAALGPQVADGFLLASARCEPRKLLDAGFTFTNPDLGGAIASALARQR